MLAGIANFFHRLNNFGVGNEFDPLSSSPFKTINNISNSPLQKPFFWHSKEEIRPVPPGQGILPPDAHISPPATKPLARIIEAAALLLTQPVGQVYARYIAPATPVLTKIDQAADGLVNCLLPWQAVQAQESSPLTVLPEPNTTFWSVEPAESEQLRWQLVDELLWYLGLSQDEALRQQLIANLTDTEIVVIPPPAAGGTREERAHEDEMKNRLRLYEISIRDNQATSDSIGARMIAWGDQQTANSYILFQQGTEKVSLHHFMAGGGEALLGFFARTLGEIFTGEILDRQPGESRAEWLLRLGFNMVTLPEQAASKAFAFKRTPAIRPVSQLPGTIITCPPSGIAMQSVLQTEIAGVSWHLFPQGRLHATAVKLGSSEAITRPATFNPHNNKWRIEGQPGEHRFTHHTTPDFFVKNGDEYLPVTVSADDGTLQLADGQKIYFDPQTQRLTPFFAANTHLHAGCMPLLPKASVTAEPGRQGVLRTQFGAERRVWKTEQGKYYLEVRSQADNPNNEHIGYIEGWPEGDFFTIKAAENRLSQPQSVLQWQAATQKWHKAMSPFSLLKTAEGQIDAAWLRSAPGPEALTPVAKRPGLYHVDHHYYLRWRNTAQGDMHYLPLLPGDHPGDYFPEEPGADDLRFRYDEQLKEWQFVPLTQQAFAGLPEAVKVHLTNPFSVDYTASGYQHLYRSGEALYIHTGTNKLGEPEYIRVEQDQADPDLFSLRLAEDDESQSQWQFRYNRDNEEFELADKQGCLRVKRADDLPCAVAGSSADSDGGFQLPDEQRSSEFASEVWQWLRQHPLTPGDGRLGYALHLEKLRRKNLPQQVTTADIARYTGTSESLIRGNLEPYLTLKNLLLINKPQPPQPPVTIEAEQPVGKFKRKKLKKSEIRAFEQQRLNARYEGEDPYAYAIRRYGMRLPSEKLEDIALKAGVDEFTLANKLSEFWLAQQQWLTEAEKQWLRDRPRQPGEKRLNYAVRLLNAFQEQTATGALNGAKITKAHIAGYSQESLASLVSEIKKREDGWFLHNRRELDELPRTDDSAEVSLNKRKTYALRLLRKRFEPPKTVFVSMDAIARQSVLHPQTLRDTVENERVRWLDDIPRQTDEQTDSELDDDIIKLRNQLYARRVAEKRDQQQMGWLVTDKEIAAYAKVTLHAFRQARESDFGAVLPLKLKPDPGRELINTQWQYVRPLLVDASDLQRSVTAEVIKQPFRLSGMAEIPQGMSAARWKEVKKGFSAQAEEMIKSDGESMRTFSQEHLRVVNGRVGLGVVAKKFTPAGTFIGGYSGVWHPTEQSLSVELRKVGSEKVLTKLWGTYQDEGSVSGYQNPNILSLMNTGRIEGFPELGENNLAVGYIGKLPFYYTIKDVEVGEELLISYGDNYNPKYNIQTALNYDKIAIIARHENRYFVIRNAAKKPIKIFGPNGELDSQKNIPKGAVTCILQERLAERYIIRYDIISKKGYKKIDNRREDDDHLYYALAKALNEEGGTDMIEEKISELKAAVSAAHPEDVMIKPEPADLPPPRKKMGVGPGEDDG
ncbi:hypothetical protein N5923_06040 [Erwiniaceae bacterium BAC15a-03b]|uniref:SET domain-containing protein n=1 Tax=Winslowiella arboricola TaxID=2978220 RepID=A0A9J6PI63_9GAMM|nr:hypothetical protein [Winslowiella arboricola]MCU5771319.1 hypothetical protein [Winslowiella arboricola]MCU5777050.1 hypothetical protein [Winslowiella arboricola]